jgi:hypothetical protein
LEKLNKPDDRLGELCRDTRVHGLNKCQPSMWDYLQVVGNGISEGLLVRGGVEVVVPIDKAGLIGQVRRCFSFCGRVNGRESDAGNHIYFLESVFYLLLAGILACFSLVTLQNWLAFSYFSFFCATLGLWGITYPEYYCQLPLISRSCL